jgi:FkbM family methyltransferase
VTVAEFVTRAGHRVAVEVRHETTDWQTLNACITHDEYGLAERGWEGTALDVGAHVGGVTLALLADNPDLHIVAIEALPANVTMLRANLELNGWTDRCTVMEAGATCEPGDVTVAYGTTGTAFESEHRFIGGAIWQDTGPQGEHVTVPGVSLSAIVAEFGPITLMKIDCEGCEWQFLADPAVGQVAEIRGEGHPRGGKRLRHIRDLLGTHDVTLDEGLDFGPFRAVLR